MTDTSGTVPADPNEPMYAQLGEDGNPFDEKNSGEPVNPPLPDPGPYGSPEESDTPEEQPGVGA